MEYNNIYDYTDIYNVDVRVTQPISAAELSRTFFSAPEWIVMLMKFRNAIMKPFGLKGERNLSDLVSIESENTAQISKTDKHLDFIIALTTATAGNENQRISVCTKVRFNNRMGKIYFALIKPFHKIICKTLIKRAKRSIEQSEKLSDEATGNVACEGV